MLSTSVAELWQRVLPPGSELLAGEKGLSREVNWASTLRVRPPAFPNLSPGEMALLSSEWLELIDPPLDLAQALEGLAQRGAAAVAVAGQVPEDAVQRAEALGMPFLQLPQGTNLYELEGAIARFISHQRALLHQKGLEIHRRLMEASIQGGGMSGLLRVLAQATGKAAAFLDREFRPRHLAASPAMRLSMESLISALAETGGLRPQPQGGPGAEPSAALLPDLLVSLADFQALASPVPLGGQTAGYLMLVGAAGELGALERLALDQASSVFAAEMAKEKAVVEAESRLKGDFLEELLEGDLADEEGMVSRARYLGYDLTGPSVVVVMRAEPQGRPGAGQAAEVIRRRLSEVLPTGAAAMVRGQEVVLVLPLGGAQEELEPAAKAEAVRRQAAEVLGGLILTAGVGRQYPGLRGLQRSYQEARRALALGREMAPGGRAHFFGSLGVYPVLFPLRGTQEAEDFVREALGPLLEYDQRNNTELVHTLDVYFSCQGNLGRTAQTLHLHRNSLAYRLRRIQEVADLSLDDVEDRFRLQLALKLRRLLNP